jgi:hypothetical protein
MKFEYPERRFDALVWNEQLYAGCSAFHAGPYADDDRGRVGGSQ